MRTFLIAYLPAYISLSSVLDWTIVFIILSIMWNIAASSKILREWSQEKVSLCQFSNTTSTNEISRR